MKDAYPRVGGEMFKRITKILGAWDKDKESADICAYEIFNALRKPTGDMMEAGQDWSDDFNQVWHSMIDAAILWDDHLFNSSVPEWAHRAEPKP